MSSVLNWRRFPFSCLNFFLIHCMPHCATLCFPTSPHFPMFPPACQATICLVCQNFFVHLFSLSPSLSEFVSLSVVVHLTLLVCLCCCLSLCPSLCLSIVQLGSLLCRRTMQTLIKLRKLNWIELNRAYFVQFINFLAKMSKCVCRRAVCLCLCVLWACHALGLLLLVSWCRRVNHITIKAAKTHLIMTSLIFNNDNFATINHLTNTNARDKCGEGGEREARGVQKVQNMHEISQLEQCNERVCVSECVWASVRECVWHKQINRLTPPGSEWCCVCVQQSQTRQCHTQQQLLSLSLSFSLSFLSLFRCCRLALLRVRAHGWI